MPTVPNWFIDLIKNPVIAWMLILNLGGGVITGAQGMDGKLCTVPGVNVFSILDVFRAGGCLIRGFTQNIPSPLDAERPKRNIVNP